MKKILFKFEFLDKNYFIIEVASRIKSEKNNLTSFKDVSIIKCFSIDKSIDLKRVSTKNKNISIIDEREIQTKEDKKNKDNLIRNVKKNLFIHIENKKKSILHDINLWDKIKVRGFYD